MQKTILILLVSLLCATPVYAECTTADECIEEGGFGTGKLNGSTRAIFYELRETNKLLKELIEEVRKDNGTIHSEFQREGQTKN